MTITQTPADIKLLPVHLHAPDFLHWATVQDFERAMQAYALACVEADRKERNSGPGLQQKYFEGK